MDDEASEDRDAGEETVLSVDAAPSGFWARYEPEDGADLDDVTVTTRFTTPLEDLQPAIEALPLLSISETELGDPDLRLQTTLGQGGMAVVRLATQTSLHREVAVKLLRPGNRRPVAAQALMHEAKITGSLEHPNIVPVHALGRDAEGAPVFIMKRIEGTPWEELLTNPEHPLPSWFPGDRGDYHLNILMQVCNGVSFAHSRGIVHRDLKPDNVMVGSFGEVYVMDWGIALDLRTRPERTSSPSSEILVGTPSYMAPEMLSGDAAEVTERTDVFLLGTLLHRILSDEPRHKGGSLVEVLVSAARCEPFQYEDDVPEELADVANKATSLNPSDRYESAEAFRRAIAEFQQHRNSFKLSRESNQKLAQLRELLARPALKDEDNPEVIKRFNEVRFGFQHALTIWRENRQAKAGLQAVIELMVERELANGDHKASAIWLSELPEPNPRLAARLETLGRSVAAREREVEKLRQIEHDFDVEVAQSDRSAFAITIAVASFVVPLGLGVLQRTHRIQIDHSANILTAIGVLALVGIATWVKRQVLLQNTANRRIMYSLLVTLAALVAHRTNAALLGTPVLHATGQDLFLFCAATGLMAVALDWRMAWASGVYLVASVLASIRPELAFELTAFANLFGLTFVALLWRANAREGVRPLYPTIRQSGQFQRRK